jgi:hypothetical protein
MLKDPRLLHFRRICKQGRGLIMGITIPNLISTNKLFPLALP